MRIRISTALAVLLSMFWMASAARSQQLGTINFPSSASAAAQPVFLEGVKDLYSFEFDEAAEAFQKVEKIDPNFALGYWGEAMSYNHPLWAEVDVDKAKKALEKLAPTADARVAKAGSPKEKAYMDAVNRLFYTPGDKLARDNAYSAVMADMYQKWPDDQEVNVFYALSLLGTVRPGDPGFRRQALAAAICMNVFQENPQHPGAAHFIIHSLDDPDHAILALPAAREYAKIAPTAPHALHMPSHIFVRLGMWQDVVNSNVVAHQAAVDLNQRMHLPEGREDFHTLTWLEYANLMLGKFDEAKKNLDEAKASDARNPGSRPVHQGYLTIHARYILETEQWEKIPVEDAAAPGAPAGGAQASSMPGMPGMIDSGRGADNGVWTFIAGFSDAKLGDLANTDKAIAHLSALEKQTEARDKYAAKSFTIMTKELQAEAASVRGQKDDAVRIAKEASDVDLSMDPPSGPPEPLKPATELYGDLLLDAGRPKEAVVAYQLELLRTPNRTPTLKGLAAAKGKLVSMADAAPQR